MSLPEKFKAIVTDGLQNQFIRFILASGANTLFGFFCFSLFIFLGFYYPLAVFFSTICGVLFNFKTIGRFVFLNNNNRLIVRFIGVYLTTYLLFTAGIGILIRLNTNTYVAGAILILPIGVTSYLLNKRFVFKDCT
jgi:putative flippase GtrA